MKNRTAILVREFNSSSYRPYW